MGHRHWVLLGHQLRCKSRHARLTTILFHSGQSYVPVHLRQRHQRQEDESPIANECWNRESPIPVCWDVDHPVHRTCAEDVSASILPRLPLVESVCCANDTEFREVNPKQIQDPGGAVGSPGKIAPLLRSLTYKDLVVRGFSLKRCNTDTTMRTSINQLLAMLSIVPFAAPAAIHPYARFPPYSLIKRQSDESDCLQTLSDVCPNSDCDESVGTGTICSDTCYDEVPGLQACCQASEQTEALLGCLEQDLDGVTPSPTPKPTANL